MQAKIYKERAALNDDIPRKTPRREKVNVECRVILISACRTSKWLWMDPTMDYLRKHGCMSGTTVPSVAAITTFENEIADLMSPTQSPKYTIVGHREFLNTRNRSRLLCRVQPSRVADRFFSNGVIAPDRWQEANPAIRECRAPRPKIGTHALVILITAHLPVRDEINVLILSFRRRQYAAVGRQENAGAVGGAEWFRRRSG